ncbi:hypothetical protein Cgig2_022924 [Carnegiea gigantea]|uniref:DUF4283 domain-containing protein n=1 Tax=Carnegiea gigantea TaxID=171969 RepID=A0A9Q1K212_9CARY|nr:hypothetical protein Cgig2_022924 [Carnegiea gigantea]
MVPNRPLQFAGEGGHRGQRLDPRSNYWGELRDGAEGKPSAVNDSTSGCSPHTELSLGMPEHKLEFIKPWIEETLNYMKICTEDIDPEVKYWESTVACDVLGAFPPFSVLTSFVKCIRHDLLIDKIVVLRKGVVLVRFDYVEMHDKVLLQGCYQFDKKPFIVRPWNKDFQKRED